MSGLFKPRFLPAFHFAHLRAMTLVLAALVLAPSESVIAADINVPAGGSNLANAYAAANPGDVLILADGDHFTGSDRFFVTKAITIRSASGNPALTRVITPNPATVGFEISASNVTLSGFRLQSPKWGILASGASNVRMKDLIIDTDANASDGAHGVYAQNGSNLLIENVTILRARLLGINFVNVTNAIVVGNTVGATSFSHGMAIIDSSNVSVVGNHVTDSGFHGIMLPGTINSRVERNLIERHLVEGVVLTPSEPPYSGRLARGNYVGQNTIISTGITRPGSAGGGVWLNEQSNVNLVFGNDATGQREHGNELFNSGDSHILANVFHRNGQGGIYTKDITTQPPPANIVIQGNYIYDTHFNAGVNVQDSSNVVVDHNFVTSPELYGLITVNVTGVTGTMNMVVATQGGLDISSSISASSFYLNRFLGNIAQSIAPGAGVTLDSGSTRVGGSHYSTFAVTGNPSTTPYNYGNGFSDRFPYQSADLGRPVQISSSFPSGAAAVGSIKTISWIADACIYVDLAYGRASSPGVTTAIATNYPNVMHYRWQVPSVTTASDYRVTITCKNSQQQTVGTSFVTPTFAVGSSAVTLLAGTRLLPPPELRGCRDSPNDDGGRGDPRTGEHYGHFHRLRRSRQSG
jgi:nitrous oxidase accessory protein NosD